MKSAPFKVKECRIKLVYPAGHGHLRVCVLVSYLKKKKNDMLVNSPITLTIRQIMGEVFLCWWEATYLTDAEEHGLCLQTKVSILF